jgi:hypothetical protein
VVVSAPPLGLDGAVEDGRRNAEEWVIVGSGMAVTGGAEEQERPSGAGGTDGKRAAVLRP